MSAKDRFRALEEGKPIKTSAMKPIEEKSNVSGGEKKKRVLVTFALNFDDLERFNSLQIKLSARDGIMYKKQDLQVACVRQFIEIAEKNIEKIKMEKF